MTRALASRLAAPLALAWMVATPAWAQPASDADPTAEVSKDACISSFEGSQTLREQGKLIEARSALQVCSAASCPDFARTRCIGWLQEVETAIPTVVISAKLADGADTAAVRVSVDGQVVAESLDGTPLDLDPGEHTLTFEHQGLPPKEERILATMGERNRVIAVRFEAAPAPAPTPAPPVAPVSPEPDPPASTPPPAGDEADSGGASPIFWVALGLGGAGLVVGGITGAMAMSQGSDLQDRCKETPCTKSEAQGDLDDAGVVADISTIAFIAGGVLTSVGVVGLIVSMGGDEEEGATARIEPVVGPGVVGLRGSF